MIMRRQVIWEIFISFFRRLCELGPVYGYLSEESKCMSIVRGENTEMVEFFRKENESCFFNLKRF